MNHQPVLQRDLQTIGEECNQHVSVGPMLVLVIDGPDSQLAFQRTKNGFDLRQLDIPSPQHGWIFAGEIVAQQIMPIALLGRLQLGLVRLKSERVAGHRLIFLWQANLHEPKRTTRFLFRGADTQQQLIALG